MTEVAAIALNALWQDALLVVGVWLILRAWPQVNAATRYVVWSAVLLAALIVPTATTLAFFTPVPPAVSAEVTATAPHGASAPMHLRTELPHLSRNAPAVTPPAVVPAPRRLRVTLPQPVALTVFAIWALLAGYAFAGLLLGLRRLETLKRDALPLPVEYRDAMPLWNEANKGRRPVRLCVSEAIDVPVAVGLFDAMILIPRELLERLSPAEVEQISLHELAHLRRGDDWSNCLARTIVAALGWNPAAFFVAQQLELEREVACDDWVLNCGSGVRPYALCLTKMAETAAWPHHPMPAPGVFTTRKQISLRIERLLGAGRDIASTLAIGPTAAALAAVAALALVITLVAPTIAASVPAAPAVAPVVAEKAAKAAKAAETTARAAAKSAAAKAATANAAKAEAAKATADAVTRVKVVYVRSSAAPAPSVPPLPNIVDGALKTAGSAIESSIDLATKARDVAQVSDGKNCIGCDYRGVNWSGRDLRGVKYTGADFTSANLAGVNFSGGRFSGVDFTKSNLAGASFHSAQLAGCDFSRANLSGADFGGAQLVGCEFSGTDLRNVNFAGATLRDCDLDGANLSGVDLSKAKLYQTSLPERPESPAPP